MNINAKLIVKEDTAVFGENGFKKREFVVEYAENPQYPEYIKFELIQDKCDMLNDVNLGSEINISFNLRGRRWTNPKGEEVYFNTLQAWKIEAKVNAHDITPQSDQALEDANAEDLPF